MKRAITALALLIATATGLIAAPEPYPVTVNSRSLNLAPVTVYRASESAFALTMVDGSTAMNLTGHTVWMAWYTNALASTVSTSSVAIVSATGGTARATFSAAAMNYTPGRYGYQVGVSSNGVIRTIRHGVFNINGSPYAAGADPVTWSTNWNLGLVTITGTFPLANLSGITSNQIATETDAAYRGAGDITGVSITAGNGLTGTVATTSGQHTQTLALNAASVASLASADTALQDFSTLTGADVAAAGGLTNAAAFEVAGAAAGLSNVLDSVAFTGELDPVWGTVSNTVTPGAAAGATAVQPTDAAYTNTAALAAGAVQDEVDPLALHTTGGWLTGNLNLTNNASVRFYRPDVETFAEIGWLNNTLIVEHAGDILLEANNVRVSNDLIAGGLVTSGNISGNGAGITSLTAANLTGNAPIAVMTQALDNVGGIVIGGLDNEAYGASWDGANEAATKDAVYDKINTFQDVPANQGYLYVDGSGTLGSTNIYKPETLSTGGWDYTSFTLDGSWHSLDLSANVSVGAAAYYIRVRGRANFAAESPQQPNLQIRRYGETDTEKVVAFMPHANADLTVAMYLDFDECRLVPATTNQSVEYKATVNAAYSWSFLYIEVLGEF